LNEEDEAYMLEEQQMFLQQQLENEFMNAADEFDDGLLLGGGVPGGSGDLDQALAMGYPKVG
jgi:hypothetical protein